MRIRVPASVPGWGKHPIARPAFAGVACFVSEFVQNGEPAAPAAMVPIASMRASGPDSGLRDAPVPPDPSGWKDLVAPYVVPTVGRSVWQVVNTLVPYALLWYLMSRGLAVSYWITLPLAVLAAGFMIRVFIIFHDCGHGSFFKSQKAADLVGMITGVLTFTPYYHWRWEHACTIQPRGIWIGAAWGTCGR